MSDLNVLLTRMTDTLGAAQVADWGDISVQLEALRGTKVEAPWPSANRAARSGVGFVTFDYGIDGVSIEIAKYADCLESLLSNEDHTVPMHFIGGDFFAQADTVIRPQWRRFEIDGVNGWSKWDDGTWFARLFREVMPPDSDGSREMAREIWGQAVRIAAELGGYVAANNIGLLIPVNINSNPGNPAYALGMVLAGELLGVYVINSNHDYYWEGGKPANEYAPGEDPGVRDHFFKNIDNRPFFSMFKQLYPWNGWRWLQVNINELQTKHLLEVDGFASDRVHELSTTISDEFLAEYTTEDVRSARRRMACILADGADRRHSVAVDAHLANLSAWMGTQRPLVVGAEAGLSFDPDADSLIYLLQPTRIISRKRIERDLHLIGALLETPAFREKFDAEERSLALHITGPVPIEHRADLQVVIEAYREVVLKAGETGKRVFIAFSVGTEDHPAFGEKGYARLHIEDIYRMATAVVFPSKTEGRGLPIIESGACGVPIICSRYEPEEVFAGVVGEHLPAEEQINYLPFPEGEFTPDFLADVAALLLDGVGREQNQQHNRRAVGARYGREMLMTTFSKLIEAV